MSFSTTFFNYLEETVKRLFPIWTYDGIKKKKCGDYVIIESSPDCIVSYPLSKDVTFENEISAYNPIVPCIVLDDKLPTFPFHKIKKLVYIPKKWGYKNAAFTTNLEVELKDYKNVIMRIVNDWDTMNNIPKCVNQIIIEINGFLAPHVQETMVQIIRKFDVQVSIIEKLLNEFVIVHFVGTNTGTEPWICCPSGFHYPHSFKMTLVRKSVLHNELKRNHDPIPTHLDDRAGKWISELDLCYEPFVDILQDDKRYTKLISAKTFAEKCDWVFDIRYPYMRLFNPSMAKDGDMVYVNQEQIDEFIKYAQRKYRIIVGNSDKDFDQVCLNKLLPFAISIKSINVTAKHEKLSCVPIGFRDWPFDTMKTLMSVKDIKKERDYIIYMNFGLYEQRQIDSRKECIMAFKNHPNVIIRQDLSLIDYYDDLLRSRYVLCPEGTGIDTHRVYEALACGAIPIVKRNSLSCIYEKLPIIIVDKWEDFDVNKKYILPELPSNWLSIDFWL